MPRSFRKDDGGPPAAIPGIRFVRDEADTKWVAVSEPIEATAGFVKRTERTCVEPIAVQINATPYQRVAQELQGLLSGPEDFPEEPQTVEEVLALQRAALAERPALLAQHERPAVPVDEERREVSSNGGMKFDGGKLRYSLLPKGTVREIVKVLELGAKKYTEENWKGLEKKRVYDAAMRHIEEWWIEGSQRDVESGLHPLSHAACNLLFLIWMEMYGPEAQSVESSELADEID